VINGSPQVSAAAKAAVQQAIEELGYVANRAARALVTQRTDVVALVLVESAEQPLDDGFVTGVLRGVSAALLSTPLQLWLAMARRTADRDVVARHLTLAHVDGALLVPADPDDTLAYQLAQRGLPVVRYGLPGARPDLIPTGARTDPIPAGGRLSYVDLDCTAGAAAAVTHLVGRGRTKVAAVASPARLASFRQALQAAGLPADESWVAQTEGSAGAGDQNMVDVIADVLRRHQDVDAIIASSDVLAAGALQALGTHGRRVPGDVAVMGYGDSPLARVCEPALTTVHCPAEAVGTAMAARLLEHMRGEPVEQQLVLVDPYVVLRGST
jgi:DNA-binding LacI/PurR family transcriptional regulator